MSDLYTSQVHLKRLLAGQATPAFTPAPDAVLKMLDPAFFPGMGALNEDEHGRLQCPVRGCGEWVHSLAIHATKKHKATGGAAAIRAALGIPKTYGLVSAAGRESYRARVCNMNSKPPRGEWEQKRKDAQRASRKAQSKTKNWMALNRNDDCPAQLEKRLTALRQKIGRSPSFRDFETEYGLDKAMAVVSWAGTWNNAKALVGLSIVPVHSGDSVRMQVAFVVESLATWHNVHGDLPTTGDAGGRKGTPTPAIPCTATIMRAFGASTWLAAMRSAAEHLGIKSERYGFDFTRKDAA